MTAAKLFGGLGGGLWEAHFGVQDGHRADGYNWRGHGEMAGYEMGNWGFFTPISGVVSP